MRYLDLYLNEETSDAVDQLVGIGEIDPGTVSGQLVLAGLDEAMSEAFAAFETLSPDEFENYLRSRRHI